MISRRHFLQQGLATVSLGLAVPSVFSRAVALAAAERSVAATGKTLVVVQLAGGVDGLNTVIPYREPEYRASRPTLAIAEESMLPIDDRFALHPSLAKMKALLDQGKLAIVQGVGYPSPTFSHFKAMDIWQSADPRGVARDGWLGRYFEGFDDLQAHPLAGLSIGRSMPSAFESDKASLPAVEGLETFVLQGPAGQADADARRSSLMRLYDVYRPAATPFAALLDTTLDNAYQSSIGLKAADAAYKTDVTYPQSSVATGLRLLAELIHSGGSANPLRVGHVTLGGFDTHSQQPAALTRLLAETSEALDAFWRDITAHGHADDVLVMTWSEFGRRVRENAQDGTDHGSAGPMFLLGNKVKGGLKGEPPSLGNLDNGNLRFTTDFRSVYATVLERWLGAPADDILGSRYPQLDLLSA